MRLSFSQLHAFQTCHYLWHLQHVRDIERVSLHERLGLGSAFHEGMAAFFRGGSIWDAISAWATNVQPDWETTYREVTSGLTPEVLDATISGLESVLDFNQEQSVLLMGVATTAMLLCQSTVRYLGNRWEVVEFEGQPLVEREFTTLLDNGAVFVGKIDAVLREVATGHVFQYDFKVREKLHPDPEWGDFDMQMGIYQYLLRENGVPAVGSILHQVRSELPRRPDMTTKGAMSRSDIVTDWDTYKAALLEEGLDPADYLDMQVKLSAKQFQRQSRTFRSQETLDAIWRNVNVVSNELIVFGDRKEIPARLLSPYLCPTCQMRDFCFAEMHGQPTNHLMGSVFKIKETKP